MCHSRLEEPAPDLFRGESPLISDSTRTEANAADTITARSVGPRKTESNRSATW